MAYRGYGSSRRIVRAGGVIAPAGGAGDGAGAGREAAGAEEPFRHGEGFVFELRGSKTHVVDSEMIGALRARAAAVGRAFSMREFNEWDGRPCAANTIRERFGNWRSALARAGIEGGRRANYTPAELMENLEAVWRVMGRAPGDHSISSYGTIGPGAYRRVWGSVKRACVLFVRYKRGKISRKALLRPRRVRRRKALAAGVRWRVLERDGHQCKGCGRRSPEVKLHVDHIVPVCSGGGNDEQNLRALCQDCNLGKGGHVARASGP